MSSRIDMKIIADKVGRIALPLPRDQPVFNIRQATIVWYPPRYRLWNGSPLRARRTQDGLASSIWGQAVVIWW
jgi:hypothetical protein